MRMTNGEALGKFPWANEFPKAENTHAASRIVTTWRSGRFGHRLHFACYDGDSNKSTAFLTRIRSEEWRTETETATETLDQRHLTRLVWTIRLAIGSIPSSFGISS